MVISFVYDGFFWLSFRCFSVMFYSVLCREKLYGASTLLRYFGRVGAIYGKTPISAAQVSFFFFIIVIII